MYNGVPAEHVTSHAGAVSLAVTDVPNGVTSRGVLLDIPPVVGCDWLDPGFGVTPEHLSAAEDAPRRLGECEWTMSRDASHAIWHGAGGRCPEDRFTERVIGWWSTPSAHSV